MRLEENGWLQSILIRIEIVSLIDFNILFGILFGPVLLLESLTLIRASISFGVVGVAMNV